MPGYSGGGGGLPPGVTGDGGTPGGLNIAGDINVTGGSDFAIHGDGRAFFGADSLIKLYGTDGRAVLGLLTVTASGNILGVVELDCASIFATGDVSSNGNLFGVTATLAHGAGLYGFTPTAVAPRTLPQATINAITDASAKAAVQACANALTDMGALTLT